MNTIPFQVCDISDPQKLFGREQLLKNLITAAKLKQNMNIIGARRFGKTCVLKSSCTLLKQQDISVFPVYIDVKSSDIKGTAAVYRYMLGILVESLYKEGIFTEPEKFGSVEVIPCDDWTEIAEHFDNLSATRIQAVFQKFVYWMSELMDKTILFMIDEYEYLFKYALDTTSGFMKMRTMSSDTLSDGSRPFCFWLTGSMSWEQLISEVPGSGEANTVNGEEFVTPISKDAFHKMWMSECNLIEDDEKKQLLINNLDFAYEKSGGVPFYGKNVIGSYILKNGVTPDYTVCQGYFQELSNKALNSGDYRILKDLAVAPQKIVSSNLYKQLKNKGIVAVNSKDISYIPIGFLKDFIIGELSDQKAIGQKFPESFSIMKTITDTIELINRQRENHGKTVVFKPVIDSSSLEYDLRTPCYTKEQLSDFASALYKFYYERIKASDRDFHNFLYGKFGKCVDIARHSIGGAHEMDYFEQHKGKFSRADLLMEIMGSPDELSSSKDYYKFQLEMLKRFKTTLDSIYKYVKDKRS